MPMREYTCAPKSRSRRAYFYVLGCVLLSAVLWTVPIVLDLPYALVWHFGVFASLTAALLITVRYLLRRYVYQLSATGDGGFDFVVTEISGKQTLCVCRISTDAFRAIAREEKGKRTRLTYDWSTDLGASAYLLTMMDGEEITVRFSPDREMAAMIAYSLRPIL